jgi:CheY-specific phosphatase CheX
LCGHKSFSSRKGAIKKMYNTNSHSKRYVLAAVLGAVAGGLVVAIATRAIPKMMSQMMSGMMQNMMAQMGEGGCDPAEM